MEGWLSTSALVGANGTLGASATCAALKFRHALLASDAHRAGGLERFFLTGAEASFARRCEAG
jgi:hypothetical protein